MLRRATQPKQLRTQYVALPRPAKEYKVIALRECPLPESLRWCDTPDKAAKYWRLHIETNPYFNRECECLAVLMLDTRRRVKGHHLVTFGTLDTILAHPREVFRAAIVASAAAIVVMHNHPSGDPSRLKQTSRRRANSLRPQNISKLTYWIT
jgi:DNA repair protein RadC